MRYYDSLREGVCVLKFVWCLLCNLLECPCSEGEFLFHPLWMQHLPLSFLLNLCLYYLDRVVALIQNEGWIGNAAQTRLSLELWSFLRESPLYSVVTDYW